MSYAVCFGHGQVSDRFLHGCGKDKLLDTLTQGLIDETATPHRIPALVAAKYEGKEYVVCSNRRLKCYKDAWHSGHECWFKVIVHVLPSKIPSRVLPSSRRLSFWSTQRTTACFLSDVCRMCAGCVSDVCRMCLASAQIVRQQNFLENK